MWVWIVGFPSFDRLSLEIETYFFSKNAVGEPDVKSFSNLRFRQSSCPPAFPNGWYKLCNSDDLPRGGVKYVQLCGQHVALFRGKKTGKIAALDAFCPHLGANMAIGGHVKDDCLVCPFHEWSFSTDGDCVNVP